MSKLTSGMFTSDSEEWTTPQTVFDMLDQEFDFTLDVCASAENHKIETYFTKEQDALKQEWGGAMLYEPTIR